MADLENYAEELLRAKGVVSLTQDDREQTKTDLIDRVDDRLNAMILDHLPDSATDAYSHLMDVDDEEELRSFLLTFIPDLDERVDIVLQYFRRDYLNGAGLPVA